MTQVSLDQTSNGDDSVQGTVLVDVVAAGLGNDSGQMGDGNDYFCGNEGQEGTMFGGTGADVMNGGSEHDIIWGENGSDTIYGGSGSDEIDGGSGTANDSLFGNLGSDVLGGSYGNDTVKGDEDPDTVFDGPGSDNVAGNAPSSGSGDSLLACDHSNVESGFEYREENSIYCL